MNCAVRILSPFTADYRRSALTCGLLFLVFGTAPVCAETITAKVYEIESGNTLTLLGGERVQLYGIDVPDVRQQCKRDGACVPCGETSRDALAATAVGELICIRKRKTFGRVIVQCSSNGVDVGRKILETGHAIIFRRNLRRGESLPADYIVAMARAKSQKTGLWGETMISPWYWRHAGRRLACER